VTLFYCTHEARSGVPVLPPAGQGLDRFGAPCAGHLRRGSNQFTYQPTPAPQHPLSSPRVHEVLRAVEAPHL